MITVHHLNKSRSKRVIWLLEELDMPYTLVKHQRDPNTNLAPESLRAIHPLAKAPIIVDDNVTLCESGAIMEYILNQSPHEQLRPTQNTQEYYQYLEWLHFAEGSLALPVISTLLMGMEKRSGASPLDHYIAKEIALDFTYIDNTLSKQTYFAGDNFTAADIMMTIILEIAGTLQLIDNKAHIKRYLETVQQRPAYQLATSQG
ncbi:glutathione S-transferase family protein [Colwellia sp. M166]|uniref:glutathione S-transferase family protein n=1 Tax=Colwellia sp. M166 TaxID=2583805 RepID=UPI00211DA9C7|nr:glutathione S-transferase family protein [Colwellia sp. M166]UUO22068.1 glutathione S-transferase family protein [Colwellia sp. M166]|tara:strand:+ start:13426 stop:14034 length:609 start_codon:yes stop_codon:yes gene_type:complete